MDYSPINLVQSRFLQEAFGATNSYFIFVVVNPIAAAYATSEVLDKSKTTVLDDTDELQTVSERG